MEENGLKKATQLAAKELGHDVTKSTVYSICNVNCEYLASAKSESQVVAELLTNQRSHQSSAATHFISDRTWIQKLRPFVQFVKANV